MIFLRVSEREREPERRSLMMKSEGLIDCNYVKQICFKSGPIKMKFFFLLTFFYHEFFCSMSMPPTRIFLFYGD